MISFISGTRRQSLLRHGYSLNIHLYVRPLRLRCASTPRLCVRTYAGNSPHYLHGDGEIRTHDPLLARQVLSQLSYTPRCFGGLLLFHTVSSIVPSAGQGLTFVFGMGTGIPPDRIATETFFSYP